MTELWIDPTWHRLVLATVLGLAVCQLNLYLTSAVLHRGMCHGTIAYPRWVKRVTAVWLWLTVCVPSLTWIAAHLHHHRYSDTDADPHAPGHKGFWRVMLLTWYYVPRYSRRNRHYVGDRYLKAYKHDRPLHLLDDPRYAQGYFYLQIASSLLGGPVALAFYIARMLPYMLLSGYVNSAGHSWGTRTYGNCGTDAHGFVQKAFGYITAGETLGHNYHHRYPGRSAFRAARFDPGFWFAVRLLRGQPSDSRVRA